ncbi:MAG: tRNA (adenosine(37)-N6)-dimethylallyltransferase MiaA [Patescibacteria group bacterium]
MPIKKIKISQPKIVVILGPTASGKTSLGVKLATRFNGEIISADSRQVYRGMDIGTGKDLAEYSIGRKKISYHLIDIIQPNTKFNLARYQKLAFKTITDILERKKLPIIVGGTGLYLQAIVDNYQLSNVKIDNKIREELEKKTVVQLLTELTALKPDFAAKLNNSDRNNPRRLVRYLEIISSSGKMLQKKGESPFDFLVLGIDISDDKMKEKIFKRLNTRLDNEGMIAEVEALKKSGVSYRRLISFGLEYKFVSYFLQGKINREELTEKLGTAIYRFAKKQKTWFRRWEKQGRKIEWLKSLDEAVKKIANFI